MVRRSGWRLASIPTTIVSLGQYHPAEPHWHLPMIGELPSMQGKGFGAALLYHGLAQCDRDGLPAYLESSNEGNISLSGGTVGRAGR